MDIVHLTPQLVSSSEGVISNSTLARSASASGSISCSTSGSATSKQINALYKGLKSFKKTIKMSSYKLTISNLHNAIYKAFIKDSYVQDAIYAYSYQCTYNPINGRVNTVRITYNFTKKTLQNRYNGLKSAIAAAKKSIGTNLSNIQVIVAAHDYLIKRATYNLPYSYKLEANLNNSSFQYNYNAHSAYGVLCKKSGVCSGYAYAYRILLNEYGINCKYVESEAMNHAWNMVKIGKQWYHVDVTWDDPDAYTDWTKNGSGKLVYYTHLLLNDTEIRKSNHYGWTRSVSSSSSIYSNMPRRSSEYQLFYGGNWYMTEEDDSQTPYSYCRYNMKGTRTKAIASVSPFYLINSRIFYQPTAVSLSSMNLDGTEVRSLETQVETSGIDISSDAIFSISRVKASTKTLYLTDEEENTHVIALTDYDLRTTDYATSLSLSASSITLKKGKTKTLKATLGPSYSISTKVTFKINSAGKKVIKVVKRYNLRLRIKGKKKGTATITVTVPNTDLKKTCKITVK